MTVDVFGVSNMYGLIEVPKVLILFVLIPQMRSFPKQLQGSLPLQLSQ